MVANNNLHISYRIKEFVSNNLLRFPVISAVAGPSSSRNEVESILEAVKYYKNKSVERLVAIPYYLGVPVDIYLFESIEDTIIVLINGAVLEHPDAGEIYEMIKPFHDSIDWTKFKKVLFSGTISPGSFIGAPVPCHEDFKDCFDYENQYICIINQQNVCNAMLKEDFEASYLFSKFVKDSKILTKNDLITKYGHFNYTQYSSILRIGLPFLQKFPYEEIDVTKFGNDWYLHDEVYKPVFYPSGIPCRIHHSSSASYELDNVKTSLEYSETCSTFNNLQKLHDSEYFAADKFQKFMDDLAEEPHVAGIRILPAYSLFTEGVVPSLVIRNNYTLNMIHGIGYRNEINDIIVSRGTTAKELRSLSALSNQVSNDMLLDQNIISGRSPDHDLRKYVARQSSLEARYGDIPPEIEI